GAPLSPPPGYLPEATRAAQSSLPESASRATQVSAGAPSRVRLTSVKAFPPAMANELNPATVGTRHRHLGAPAGNEHWTLSCEMPSTSGPRYWNQSAPRLEEINKTQHSAAAARER